MKKILSLIICLLVVVSITGCKKEDKNNNLNEIKNENGNIKLVLENELDKDVKLETRVLDNYINLSASINKYESYSISLVKYIDNEKEKIDLDNVTVFIKIPDGYNKEKLAVYHVSNGCIMKNYDFEIDGKYVKFKPDSLSGYAIAELK